MKITLKQIYNVVQNIEKNQNTENRHDRLKALERENHILRGNQEETDRRLRAIEAYLKVEYVRESIYKKQTR